MTLAAELQTIRERVNHSLESAFTTTADIDRARLLDAVEKVLELHAPTEDNPPQCSTCQDYWYPSQNVEYPCDTVRAITTALEGK